MTHQELKNILTELRELPKETEVVEFKKAKNDYGFTKLAQFVVRITDG